MTEININQAKANSSKPTVAVALTSGSYIGGIAGVGLGHACNAFMATLNTTKAAETGYDAVTIFASGTATSALMVVATAGVVALQSILANGFTEVFAEGSEGVISKESAANIRICTTVAAAVVAACVTTAKLEGHESYFNSYDGIVSSPTLKP